MRYEAVIGLEIHIQLATESKLFSSSPTQFGAPQNTQVNEIDLAYPGVLPVLNKQAVKFACLFAVALDGKINPHAVFMRKNYFYPDSPKGYQISQLDDAIIQGGAVVLESDDGKRTVRINRGQLEEDAGKSVHDHFSDRTGIDLNRAGVPLIELVSEPDMHSAKEAVQYMKYIHHLVRYLGISDGNMQEGSFRCDANVSIREKGSDVLNSRVELKNINSFRFVEQAINIEIERQSELMDAGKTVIQETRLFDPDKQETRTMRTKEEANDYRYFPDPDLLPLNLSQEFIDETLEDLPELPDVRKARYQNSYQLDEDIINVILQNRYTADFFDRVCEICKDGKLAANWQTGELAKRLNEQHLSFDDLPIKPEQLGEILKRMTDNEISASGSKKLLDVLWEGNDDSIDALIKKLGLKQVNDDGALQVWVAEVLDKHPDQVQAYLGGQEKMLGFFVGQVMKMSKGKANPKSVNEMIVKALSER